MKLQDLLNLGATYSQCIAHWDGLPPMHSTGEGPKLFCFLFYTVLPPRMVGREECIFYFISGSRPTYDKALTYKVRAYMSEGKGYTKPFPHFIFYYISKYILD